LTGLGGFDWLDGRVHGDDFFLLILEGGENCLLLSDLLILLADSDESLDFLVGLLGTFAENLWLLSVKLDKFLLSLFELLLLLFKGCWLARASSRLTGGSHKQSLFLLKLNQLLLSLFELLFLIFKGCWLARASSRLTGGGHKQSLLLFKLIKLLLGLFKLHLLFSKRISLWGRRQHILYWALGDLILEFVVGYHAQHPLAHTSSSNRLFCQIVDIETFTLEDGVEFLDRFVLNLIFLEFTQSLHEVRVIHFFLSIVPASLYAQQDLDCVHTLYDILRRRFETLHLGNETLV